MTKSIFLLVFLPLIANAAANVSLFDKIKVTTSEQFSNLGAGVCSLDGSGNVGSIAPGSSGNLLTSNGSAWVSSAAPAAGVSSMGAFGGSSSSTGATISGTVLTMTPADGTNPGEVTTGTQTFAGAKTLSGAATFSASGAASTPAALFSGTPFAGTATTSKFLLGAEWGSPTSTNWPTGGTAIGVNAASAFTGKLLDLQANGVDVFSVDYGGNTNSSRPGVTVGNPSNSGNAFSICNAAGNPSANDGCLQMYMSSGYTFSFHEPQAPAGDQDMLVFQANWGTTTIGSKLNGQTFTAQTQPFLLINNFNSAFYNANPTLGLMLKPSQTGPLLDTYVANSTTELGTKINADGTFVAVGITDSALGAGMVRSSSGGLLSSAEISGDCTTSGSNAITCTKTNGSAFGTLATLNAAPAGTLTGTTLNSTVVTSSLTSVGTIATGVWNGTTISAANGGTGTTTLAAHGVVIGNGTSAVNVTGSGTSGQVLTSNGASADPTFQNAASSPRSQVQLDSGNGFGSTNTKVRRFSNTDVNTGSDITYADSATLGASFTINTAGVYSVHYNDANGSSGIDIGITVNGSTLSSSVNGMTYANGLRAISSAAASAFIAQVNWTGILNVNDVVRPGGGSTLPNVSDTRCMFTITKVSN